MINCDFKQRVNVGEGVLLNEAGWLKHLQQLNLYQSFGGDDKIPCLHTHTFRETCIVKAI